jgi:hypothetical protein
MDVRIWLQRSRERDSRHAPSRAAAPVYVGVKRVGPTSEHGFSATRPTRAAGGQKVGMEAALETRDGFAVEGSASTSFVGVLLWTSIDGMRVNTHDARHIHDPRKRSVGACLEMRETRAGAGRLPREIHGSA